MGASTVAAILTCHNRRDKTLACLASVEAQRSVHGYAVSILLADDASTDGTAEAVAAQFPMVSLIHGDGTLYWNGGMRLAMTEAMKGDPDFYWWLNDDTFLDGDAFARLLDAYELLVASGAPDPIVVGSTEDPQTGQLTYGGWVRCSWWHPLRFRLVEPGPGPVRCDAMNGNCALIPRSAVEKVGNLDPAFTQGRGDFDYALRAWKAGCSVWVAPGYLGTCPRNPTQNTWKDAELPLKDRFRRVVRPKGLPPQEWATFSRRHAGALWPLFSVSPYVKMLVGSLRRYLPTAHRSAD